MKKHTHTNKEKNLDRTRERMGEEKRGKKANSMIVVVAVVTIAMPLLTCLSIHIHTHTHRVIIRRSLSISKTVSYQRKTTLVCDSCDFDVISRFFYLKLRYGSNRVFTHFLLCT